MGTKLHPDTLPWRRSVDADTARRPVVGVMCCNAIANGRCAQTVSTRFIEPLHRLSHASVLLVPAMTEAVDVPSLVPLLDGLLLTGACSNVAPSRYGNTTAVDDGEGDAGRDAVALALAARMIEAGRPVFGICRGLQELNVLFGGTLSSVVGESGHHYVAGQDTTLKALFSHRHAVEVADGGLLAGIAGSDTDTVNSVHRQGIDRLGRGLVAEAFADDGLVEAVSANPCGAMILGVQWHPEWDVADNAMSRKFFELFGQSISRREEASFRL